MSRPAFEVQLSGEGRAMWREAVGRDRFPVRSPEPVLCVLPGFTEPQPCYLLAVEALSIPGLQMIARHLAAMQGGAVDEVLRAIQTEGLPIRAEGTSVAIDPRFVL